MRDSVSRRASCGCAPGKRRTVCRAVIYVAASLAFLDAVQAGVLTAWVVPSLVRVGRTSSPGTATSATLYAAKGETESFQIAIKSQGNTKGITVTAPDLVSSSGAVIGRSNVTLYRENFANVTAGSPNWGGSNQPGGPGWYADGLIPFVNPDTGRDLAGTLDAAPFDMSPSSNEVIWVDINVPRTAAAGRYTGTFLISSTSGSAAVPVTLNVWKFSLPVKPAATSAAIFFTTANTLANVKELLRHRVMPFRVQNAADEPSLISQFGLNTTSLPFWSGASYGQCTMSAAPSTSEVTAAAVQHPAGLPLYVFSADEITECVNALAPMIKQWARNIHAAGVDHFITTPPTPALFDDGSGTGRSAVDIWCELPVQYDSVQVGAALAKGDRVWSYNPLVQDAYSPKWQIDFPLINERAHVGFIHRSLSFRGFLVWRVDLWSIPSMPSYEPWTNPNNTGYFSPGNFPGEGMILYPGEKVGLPGRAIPSMRLKALRDGVDDFDYVEILTQLGQGTYAMSIVQGVGASWTNWTKDPVAIENARLQLGNRIDQLTP